jgi:hypothetical protein
MLKSPGRILWVRKNIVYINFKYICGENSAKRIASCSTLFQCVIVYIMDHTKVH